MRALTKVLGLLDFSAYLVFSYSIWLISGFFPIEHIRGDIYAMGRPAYAHYSLNIRSERFAYGS